MRSLGDAYGRRYPAEAADHYCIAPDVAAAVLRDRPWRRLAVLGDLAEGLPEPSPGYATRTLTDRLADALASNRVGFEVLRPAVPATRLRDVRHQLEAAVTFRPDVVIASAGAADALEPHFDPARAARTLDRLLRPLAESGAFVVTLSMYDREHARRLRPHESDAFRIRLRILDDITHHLTRDLGGVHVDLTRHPLVRDSVVGPDLLDHDGYDANARGHAVAFAAVVVELATRG